MTTTSPSRRQFPIKPVLLIALLLTGVILHQLKIIDIYQLLRIAERYAEMWWFPPFIILIKIVLYTFALPGSTMYWVAGLLYRPLTATVIIVMGGVLGAVSAYFFSSTMSGETEQRISNSRFFSLLRKHGDFFTLTAARILPNFPHSVINYGSGLIRIPFVSFLFSTIIGFTVKGYIYAAALHQATEADDLSDVLTFETALPLVILTVLIVIGKLIQIGLHRRTTAPE